jgi:hypothetical protein
MNVKLSETPPFTNPPNVMGKIMKRQPNGKRQTREPPKNNFDSF